MRRCVHVVAVVIVVAVAITACGDDGGSGADDRDESEQEFVDAITQEMQDEIASDPANPMTAEDSECVAGAIVDVLGVEGLVGLGLDVAAIEAGDDLEDVTLEPEQADEIIDAMFGCVDFGAIIATGMGLDTISEGSRDCLGDFLEGSEAFRAAMAADMLGQDPADFADLDRSAQTEIIGGVMECLSAEEIVQLGLDG